MSKVVAHPLNRTASRHILVEISEQNVFNNMCSLQFQVIDLFLFDLFQDVVDLLHQLLYLLLLRLKLLFVLCGFKGLVYILFVVELLLKDVHICCLKKGKGRRGQLSVGGSYMMWKSLHLE